MKAMILAAGIGQRMRPLTNNLPKPLLRAGSKALIDYHLEALATAGISDVIINLAYLGEKIRAHVGNGAAYGLQVVYSPEPEPLETGGALLQALPLLGNEPFLLVNGDVWCDMPFGEFSAQPLASEQLGRLLLVPNPGFHPEGDFALSATGLLQAKTPAAASYTFAGISLLRPALIARYPERRAKFPLVEALRHALAGQQLSGQVYNGRWSDVGTPQRLQALDELLA